MSGYDLVMFETIQSPSAAERLRAAEAFVTRYPADAEVLIIDSQYDDAEYQTHVGWGHGCVDDVVTLALCAGVKQLFLFHHDPDHTDAQITKMQAWARQIVEFHGETLGVDAACEGVQYVLNPATAETAKAEV